MVAIISSGLNFDFADQIRALHRLEFGPKSNDYENNYRSTLEKALADKRIVTATDGGELHGFGIYFFLNESDHHPLWWYEAAFQDQKTKETLVQGIQEKARAAGYQGEINLKLYKNSFARNYHPKESDMYMAGLIVEKGKRRQGIGTQLMVARLDIARANGSSNVFVDCCLDDRVDSIYRKFGFLPAVRIQPGDWNGSAYLNMGLKL